MAKRGVLDHPKFSELKALLGANKSTVLGYLECVWQFTGRYAPQGNIGKFTDRQIEAWCEWDGEPGELIGSMVASGWLDRDENHRLLVHDWCDHVDNTTRTSLKRSGLDVIRASRVSAESQQYSNGVTTLSQQCVDTASRVKPEPEPEPVPEPEPDARVDGIAQSVWQILKSVPAFANGSETEQSSAVAEVVRDFEWLPPETILGEAKKCRDHFRGKKLFAGKNTAFSASAGAKFRDWIERAAKQIKADPPRDDGKQCGNGKSEADDYPVANW